VRISVSREVAVSEYTIELSAGLTSVDEFDKMHNELKTFTNAPGTIVASPRMIQTWARRA